MSLLLLHLVATRRPELGSDGGAHLLRLDRADGSTKGSRELPPSVPSWFPAQFPARFPAQFPAGICVEFMMSIIKSDEYSSLIYHQNREFLTNTSRELCREPSRELCREPAGN